MNRDPSSKGQPFLGGTLIGGDTVVVHDLPNGGVVARNSSVAHGLFLFYATICCFVPMFFLANDFWRWFDLPPIGWLLHSSIAVGVAVAAVLSVFPFAVPRTVAYTPADGGLRYRIGGIRDSEFVISIAEITSAEIITTAYILKSTGDSSTCEEIPIASAKDHSRPMYRHTVVCRLKSGDRTFPMASGNRNTAQEFVRHVVAQLPD